MFNIIRDDGLHMKKKEISTLSAYIMIGILKSRIRYMKTKLRTIYPSMFRKQNVIQELYKLPVHEQYQLVPVDKACQQCLCL